MLSEPRKKRKKEANNVAANVYVSRQPKALHPRNKHHGHYDFKALCHSSPALKAFVRVVPSGRQSIDFTDEKAVVALNQALLLHFYGVKNWNIPAGYLCPPIPGRADYIHYLADLLAQSMNDSTVKVCCDEDANNHVQFQPQHNIRVLDIGTGANCIYPIIGSQVYGWEFVASDIDSVSIKAAKSILKANSHLDKKISLIQQHDAKSIFKGIIQDTDYFDLTLCNPPFHASIAEAEAGTIKKWKNLDKSSKAHVSRKHSRLPSNSDNKSKRNFGGQQAELWCPGGEIAFLKSMAWESQNYAQQVRWFSSLVSKSENVRPLKKRLQELGVKQIKVIKMSQGQKVSRLIAWSFLANEKMGLAQ